VAVRTRLAAGGRLVIPVEYRKALGIGDGDEVVLTLEDGDVRITTPLQAIRRMQALVHSCVPEGTIASEELIRERRAEAGRE
jgi:AbrB family looped-hinge helix DNA binding protein